MEDGFFNLKSLREQVYEYLKIQLNEGKLEHGAFLNLNAISAEMGISTDKLHARGPMGLEELTTYKYVVTGNGQTR